MKNQITREISKTQTKEQVEPILPMIRIKEIEGNN